MPADMPQTVDAVAGVFQDLGIQRPHVAGNSLGGAIALELAAADLVTSATAFAPAGFGRPWHLSLALGIFAGLLCGSHLPEPVLRTTFRVAPVRKLAYAMVMSKPERLTPERALYDAKALRNAKGISTVVRAGRDYAYRGTPTVPVTVAWGTHDRILPYRQSKIARERLPDCRHVDLAGCGHVPMSDDPERVASLILSTTTYALSKL
jgi:pimeloyl-ACP methyl ester carboxylesterase